MIMKGNYISLLVSNKKIKVCFGCDESHVVSCECLRNEDLHTFLGMVGYCMKDNGEERLEFVHINCVHEELNEGKMEYAKWEDGFEQSYESLS